MVVWIDTDVEIGRCEGRVVDVLKLYECDALLTYVSANYCTLHVHYHYHRLDRMNTLDPRMSQSTR